MAINSNWYAPKLNGVPFYCEEANLPELGRKISQYDYPDTDSRYVEDRGGIRPTYTITASITANRGTASNFKSSKKKFEKALSKQGTSVLIHPTRGRKEVVITKAEQFESVQGVIGKAIYKFIAVEADKNKFPTKVDGSKSFLNKLQNLLTDKQKDLLKDITEKAESGLETYNSFRDTVNEAMNTISQTLETINGINDEVSALTADITNIKNTINDLVNFPNKFADSFMKNFDRLLQVTTNFGDAFKLQENAFNNTPATNNLVGATAEVQNTINNVTRVALMGNAYQAMTQIEYTEQGQVDLIIKRVEAMYKSINELSIDDNTYTILENMRKETLLLLANLKLNLPFTTTIETNNLPAIALAYNLYYTQAGSEYDNILNLNKIQDPSSIGGTIKIFAL